MHPGRDGRWIRCAKDGHCEWTAHSSVVAARLRLFEAARGPLPWGVVVETVCREARCVNLDHLRLVRASSRTVGGNAAPRCRRGHPLTGTNVVRHRDGRVAYCRLCRNERRRERYREDPNYAQHEIERQRRRRARA